jgi:hypothetical protein
MIDKFSILNVNNYNKELVINKKKTYLKSYFRIINDYLKHIIDRVQGDYNNEYYLFIITRGLSTLKHIFINLTTYTKNIELVTHHSDKSTLYYVEFIEQIGNDNNSYLKLNSKDAALFIYKKTIFDINNEYRKKIVLTNNDKQLLTLFERTFKITNMLIDFSLQSHLKNIKPIERQSVKFKGKITKTLDENFKAMFKIFKIIYDITDLNQNIRKINILFHLVDLLLSKKCEGIKIFNICELFAKKCNNTITIDGVSKKMLNDDYLNTVDNPKKFIAWLIRN